MTTVWLLEYWLTVLVICHPVPALANNTALCYLNNTDQQDFSFVDMAVEQAASSFNTVLKTVVVSTDRDLHQLMPEMWRDCLLMMVQVQSCLRASALMATPPPFPLLLLTSSPCPDPLFGPTSNNVALVSTMPWLSLWPRSACDVIHAMGWTKVVIIADHTLSVAHHAEMTFCLAHLKIGSVSMRVDNAGTRDVIHSLVTSVEATGIYSLLLCTSGYVSRAILSAVNEKALNCADYRMVMGCPGARSEDVSAIRVHGFGLLTMTPVQLHSSHACLALPTHTQIAVYQIMAGINSLNILPNQLPLCNSVWTTTWPVPCVQNGTVQIRMEEEMKFSICDSRQGEVAVWRPDRPVPLTIQHAAGLTDHFTYFHNNTLIVATLQALPFVRNTTNNGKASYEGLCIDIINTIAEEVNFNYVIIAPPDGMYGAPDENDTWNGMVGMVKRGEADLAIGPFTITSSREAVVDFTVPYMEDGGGILSRKTNPKPDLMRIFSPFTADIWLATGGMVLLFGFVLFIINKYNSSYFTDPRAELSRDPSRSWNIASSLWTVFSSIMEQGAESQPRTTSARFVLGCWWIFTILIMSVYTATLAAMLTVTKQPDHIDSIEQVATSTFTPITLAGTNWETLFETAENGVYKEIGDQMRNGPVVLDVDEALDFVRRGVGVFLYDISQTEYLYKQDCDALHQAERIFNANGLGFVLPQKSPYKKPFDTVILKLQEGGFMSMWRKRWWRGNGQCARDDQGASLSQGKQMDVISIGGILVIYGVVVMLAVLSAGLQCLFRRFRCM